MPELTEFEGQWRIARRIEDAWGGSTGLFDGVARFTPDGVGLSYRETGELRLPFEGVLAASRSYLWRRDGDGIGVYFTDGRWFHRIAGKGRVARDWHDCMPDTYEVTYNFTRWPEWRVIWKVTGPRKDYVAISDLTRI